LTPVRALPGSTRVVLIPDTDPLPDWVRPDALSAAELARLASLRHPAAAEHFRRGRLAVRSLLAAELGCHPRAVPIRVAEHGKPVCDGAHFNVSHTAGLVAIAVGSTAVGIDVEAADPRRDVAGLVRRFFADEEREQFDHLPDHLRHTAFLRGWTCKEALLKGIGTGVRDLRNCAVCLDPGQLPRVLRCPTGVWSLEAWQEGPIGVAVATAQEQG
jgi:4'-phosphopantetheinyl transferase